MKSQYHRLFALLCLCFVQLSYAVSESPTITKSAQQPKPPEITKFADRSALIPLVRDSLSRGGDGIAGVAWFDYDNDGDDDLYLLNGPGGNNVLYQNNGKGDFVDVTDAAGIGNGTGNVAVLAADIDNDGHQDLLLTGDGSVMSLSGATPLKLYRNNGDKTFTDVSVNSGLAMGTQMMASAADIDNDGDLDLFITAPGSLTLRIQDQSKLFLNQGNMTFTDITSASGITSPGLGACVTSFSDYNNDGLVDLFVGNCNDISFIPTPMQLFHNNGNGTFTDVSQQTGLAQINGYWMSATFGDFNNDGWIDLFSTNIGSFGVIENDSVLLFNHHGVFEEQGLDAGVAKLGFSWGASANDFNNDGWLDLIIVGNLPQFDLIGSELGNPGYLFLNMQQRGTIRFADFSDRLPLDLRDQFVSGLAAADFDADGDMDVAIANETFTLPGQTLLFENTSAGHWLNIKLQGTRSNKDAIGARVTLYKPGLSTQTREVYASSSFASTESKILHFGLGKNLHRGVVRVDWPAGGSEWFSARDVDTTLTLIEGEGKTWVAGK